MMPTGNHFIVALEGHMLYLLTTPVHAIQETPDTAGRVTNFEQHPNHMTNALQCPVVFAISMSICASQKFLF
jgi:predicted LPLAT superfamily acyltransferase